MKKMTYDLNYDFSFYRISTPLYDLTNYMPVHTCVIDRKRICIAMPLYSVSPKELLRRTGACSSFVIFYCLYRQKGQHKRRAHTDAPSKFIR